LGTSLSHLNDLDWLETPVNKNATNIILYLGETDQWLLKGKYIQMCLSVIHSSIQV